MTAQHDSPGPRGSPQPASGSVPQPAIGYGFAFSTLPLPQ